MIHSPCASRRDEAVAAGRDVATLFVAVVAVVVDFNAGPARSAGVNLVVEVAGFRHALDDDPDRSGPFGVHRVAVHLIAVTPLADDAAAGASGRARVHRVPPTHHAVPIEHQNVIAIVAEKRGILDDDVGIAAALDVPRVPDGEDGARSGPRPAADADVVAGAGKIWPERPVIDARIEQHVADCVRARAACGCADVKSVVRRERAASKDERVHIGRVVPIEQGMAAIRRERAVPQLQSAQRLSPKLEADHAGGGEGAVLESPLRPGSRIVANDGPAPAAARERDAAQEIARIRDRLNHHPVRVDAVQVQVAARIDRLAVGDLDVAGDAVGVGRGRVVAGGHRVPDGFPRRAG